MSQATQERMIIRRNKYL